VNAIVDNAPIYTLGSKDLEIEGWLKLAGTSAFLTGELGLGSGIYHNIDRAAFPEWEGNVVNAAAALSLANIRTTRDALFKRTNDEQTNLGIASTEVMRDFEALLVANQRFVPATQLKAGYSRAVARRPRLHQGREGPGQIGELRLHQGNRLGADQGSTLAAGRQRHHARRPRTGRVRGAAQVVLEPRLLRAAASGDPVQPHGGLIHIIGG
jgi:hypothetical protein